MIAEHFILTAAHCNHCAHYTEATEIPYLIGLGVHEISKFRKSVEYFLKHPRTLKYRDIAIRTVKKISIHPNLSEFFKLILYQKC